MKMNAKRRMIPAIAMLAISAVVLSTASYAWFTMSRSVTATGITLKAVAPTNLQISNAVDGTFGETTELTMSFGENKLIPASSADGLNFYAPNQIKEANGGAPVADTKFSEAKDALSADKSGYYADFKLWLKTTGEENVDVTVAQLLSTISDKTGELSGAARFAVLNADGTALLKPGTNNVYGTKAGTSVVDYFDTVTGPLKADCLDTATNADAWKGAAIMANSTNTLFTCEVNKVVPITVRVWLEGQDKDCISPTEGVKPEIELTVGFADVAYAEANPTTTTPSSAAA